MQEYKGIPIVRNPRRKTLELYISLGGQPEVEGAPELPQLNWSSGWIQSTHVTSAAWDLPATTIPTSNASDPTKCGDVVWSATGSMVISVGGRWQANTGAGLALLSAAGALTQKGGGFGARLAYLCTEDAMTPSASTRSAGLLMSSPSKGNDREELARMVEEARKAAEKETEAEAKAVEEIETKEAETKEARI